MQPKDGIAGTVIHIQLHARHREMSRPVDARKPVQHGAEVEQVPLAERQRHVDGLEILRRRERDVPVQTARVVARAVERSVGLVARRSQVDSVLVGREWAPLHATTPRARVNGYIARLEVDDGGRAVGDHDAVAPHRPGRSVEDRALAGIFPVDGPVPVGLGTLVAAFLAEGLLVEVHVVPVETEEETVAVDEVGLEVVGAYEVVVPGPSTRERGRVWSRRGVAGLLGEAVDRVDVV